MTQTLITVAAFVLLLAMVPMAIKWLQSRGVATGPTGAAASRVLSAVAVGPHQRVVTVEVGPVHDRVCLVLGVTAQTIACLHTSAAGARTADGTVEAFSVAGPRA
ncbi:MAG: flagellar biosynthetic protein FliO [Betaproteobacteria bacterium]